MSTRELERKGELTIISLQERSTLSLIEGLGHTMTPEALNILQRKMPQEKSTNKAERLVIITTPTLECGDGMHIRGLFDIGGKFGFGQCQLGDLANFLLQDGNLAIPRILVITEFLNMRDPATNRAVPYLLQLEQKEKMKFHISTIRCDNPDYWIRPSERMLFRIL